MKRAAIGTGLVMALMIGFMGGASAWASGSVKFYFGIDGAYSFLNMKSGGYNTSGDFSNTGEDKADLVVPGGHIGLEFSGLISLDLGFHYRGNLKFTTNGYAPDIPYQTAIDAYSLIFSLFVKFIPNSTVSPYAGAGVGGTSMKMTTGDSVVTGNGTKTSLAWQVEAGIRFDPTSLIGLKLGYRYATIGSSDIPLLEYTYPAGNFTADLTASEIFVGLQFKF